MDESEAVYYLNEDSDYDQYLEKLMEDEQYNSLDPSHRPAVPKSAPLPSVSSPPKSMKSPPRAASLKSDSPPKSSSSSLRLKPPIRKSSTGRNNNNTKVVESAVAKRDDMQGKTEESKAQELITEVPSVADKGEESSQQEDANMFVSSASEATATTEIAQIDARNIGALTNMTIPKAVVETVSDIPMKGETEDNDTRHDNKLRAVHFSEKSNENDTQINEKSEIQDQKESKNSNSSESKPDLHLKEKVTLKARSKAPQVHPNFTKLKSNVSKKNLMDPNNNSPMVRRDSNSDKISNRHTDMTRSPNPISFVRITNSNDNSLNDESVSNTGSLESETNPNLLSYRTLSNIQRVKGPQRSVYDNQLDGDNRFLEMPVVTDKILKKSKMDKWAEIQSSLMSNEGIPLRSMTRSPMTCLMYTSCPLHYDTFLIYPSHHRRSSVYQQSMGG
jgi:hypothetical protein